MVLARNEGISPASNVTRVSPPMAAPAEVTSAVCTPYNCEATYRLTHQAIGSATPQPMASSNNTSRITSQATLPRGAPRAIRRPISFVRRATVKAITP